MLATGAGRAAGPAPFTACYFNLPYFRRRLVISSGVAAAATAWQRQLSAAWQSVCVCVCVCVMVRTLNGAYTRRPRCCHYLIHYAASQTVAMQARIWLRYRGPVYETSEWGLTCPTLANIIGYFGYKSLQFIICTGTDNRT